jgi:hypothetical protein
MSGIVSQLKSAFVVLGVAALLTAATSSKASASTIVFNNCFTGDCFAFEGNVTAELSLVAGSSNDLQIIVTNNLTSGAITELGFAFDPFAIAAGSFVLQSSSSVTLTKLSSNLNQAGFDLFFKGGLDADGAGAFGPGETITLIINTTPDLTNLLLDSATGGLEVEGACQIGSDCSFKLDGSAEVNPTSVPEPASMGLLGLGLFGLARKFRKRAN